jgi:hypothetical protein
LDDVLDQFLLTLAAQEPGDAREPAQPGEPEQRGETQDPEAGDRAQQVEPATALDEVVAPGVRPREVDREVEQEHRADRVVIDLEDGQRGLVEGQQQQPHDPERQDRQDEDEDVVGVAVLSHGRCLFLAHP